MKGSLEAWEDSHSSKRGAVSGGKARKLESSVRPRRIKQRPTSVSTDKTNGQRLQTLQTTIDQFKSMNLHDEEVKLRLLKKISKFLLRHPITSIILYRSYNFYFLKIDTDMGTLIQTLIVLCFY